MLDKLKTFLEKTNEIWRMVQDVVSIKGGLYIDMFAVVMIARLIGAMFGKPPLTVAEAGLWGATIAAFAYSGTNGPKGS